MLKEVGASGQISLGKKYAGQLFDMVFYPDGRVELVPMKVLPAVQAPAESTHSAANPGVQEQLAAYRVGDGWLTPDRLAALQSYAQPSPGASQLQSNRDWAEAHAAEIEQYNAWAGQREPYSQRVRRWREASSAPQPSVQPGLQADLPDQRAP